MNGTMSAKSTMPIMTAMLEGLFDYAGLFPPAALSMEAAVQQYHQHLQCEHNWMLGKFVLPVGRLDEFTAAARRLVDGPGDAWRLSLLTTDWQHDWPRVAKFAAAHSSVFDVKSIETRNPAALDGNSSFAIDAYVELAVSDQLPRQIESLKSSDAYAKIRTGGLEAIAFPSAAQVANFLTTAAQQRVACKATAGLHHALASVRITHVGDDAPSVAMHGFVNVVLANALIRKNAPTPDVIALLNERNSAAFRFDSEQVEWRAHVLTTADLQHCRGTMFHAIGSCSFSEPVCDLQQLGWL
jgi:hypothetical protein